MTPETLEALKGSIEKWQRIEAGADTDKGTDNCPLCQLFHEDHRLTDGASCDGCPVSDRTGKLFCRGTPYMDYTGDGKTKANARAELEFLRSLLPKEETP
jgi:hypothetical protein